MSLKELARKALAQSCPAVPVPKRCPSGTTQADTGARDFKPSRDAGTFVPRGTVWTAGTSGTTGTDGTNGTNGTARVLSVDDYEERAAILEYEGGLPRDWAERFARLLCDGPPGDFSPVRWQAAIDGALRFVDEWGREGYRLG